MKYLTVEHAYNIPVKKLWDIYTAYDSWNRWAGFSTSVLSNEGKSSRYGTGAVRCLGSMGVNTYEEILEFEPPVRFTYTVKKGGLPMKSHLGEVLLSEKDGITTLTWKCRFEPSYNLIGSLMRIFIKFIFKRSLKGLEKYLKKTA
jgi:uncharacterized protein YndB with AHSA1/START domain